VESIRTIIDLIAFVKQSVHQTNNPKLSSSFEPQLISATSKLVTFGAKLVTCSKVIAFTSKNPQYKQEMEPLIIQTGLSVLKVSSSALSVKKSPFNRMFLDRLVETTNAMKGTLSQIIKVSVLNNKGKGGENKQNKDDFLFAIKGAKEALFSIGTLTIPDGLAEILSSVDSLLLSCDELGQVSGSEKDKENLAKPIKKVKDSMRLTYALIHVCEPAATNKEAHTQLQSTALK